MKSRGNNQCTQESSQLMIHGYVKSGESLTSFPWEETQVCKIPGRRSTWRIWSVYQPAPDSGAWTPHTSVLGPQLSSSRRVRGGPKHKEEGEAGSLGHDAADTEWIWAHRSVHCTWGRGQSWVEGHGKQSMVGFCHTAADLGEGVPCRGNSKRSWGRNRFCV